MYLILLCHCAIYSVEVVQNLPCLYYKVSKIRNKLKIIIFLFCLKIVSKYLCSSV